MGEAKLVAMMPVRNEAGRYLREVLTDLSLYVDEIVILDDASTDETPALCESFPKVILHRNPEPLFFVHEGRLRAQLWEYTVQRHPDWILAIDADEIFEERMGHEVRALINQTEYEAIEFRLFDFWGDRTHVRVDGGWNPWAKAVRMLFRYESSRAYSWPDKPFHCGRIPVEVRGPLPVYQSDIRVKHYGWADPADIRRKALRYRERDDSAHLRSVWDPPEKVRLERWIEGKRLPF